MNTSQMISSAFTAAVFTQAAPVSSSSYHELGFSILSAVLAAVLSWLSGRRQTP